MTNSHWSNWLLRVQWLLLLLIALSGVALRFGLLHFSMAFKVFIFAGGATLLVALLSLFVFVWGMRKGQALTRSNALWAALLGLLPLAVPLATVGKGNFDLPRIHDITTDTRNPPQYQAVLALRQKGDNSAQYEGSEVAQLQRGADIYADIVPLHVHLPVSRTTEVAADVAEELGWEIVSFDPQKGHLEAVDKTPILGFTDDIVVRVRAEEDGGSRVDVRSSSRVGVGDLGANAKRIRLFLEELHLHALVLKGTDTA
ncbi:DUF1499 domain-containing protein [Microbulbifer sp. OS29]|uniref:DUF1499 domain-containing protein n=1 Tax=Microbulbifer okhotskensis TaxID=2926617 RepID=A0A9X2ETH3_9GAMM|nr:DUF1499 domain-containing protein [Microbulbifer okhotskensis]MCO1335268.1 DUF1499 domain-containing protein [Microbulbifer okhotskensis]